VIVIFIIVTNSVTVILIGIIALILVAVCVIGFMIAMVIIVIIIDIIVAIVLLTINIVLLYRLSAYRHIKLMPRYPILITPNEPSFARHISTYLCLGCISFAVSII